MTETKRIAEIEQGLTQVLARERCSSQQGCSALANVLLEAFARCRRDPLISAAVADEMRRLAAQIVRLADADVSALGLVITDGRVN